MSDATRAVLLGVLVLASCVWVGGYVAIAVVAQVAIRTLEPVVRVAFFRGLGRSYLRVGAPALVIALGAGAALAAEHAWDGALIAAAVLAATLVVALVIGVLQARRMTRLRSARLAAPHNEHLDRLVQRGARRATALRAVIGLLSLALIAIGALLTA